ncbi:extracellular solute-binding protein [Paenibacillus aurantius]|uniref:Extracellular solute-binding protein n=1 Tax=Paenibacillus aurantius TaxID=2918900 RepID=A0AA96LFP5_9BACL|nr:extracellular solute-binding protein [Paenibacillus aurantius]WNQ13179.1 extracellular solute-binding protein [Paenibacillus aurantius]
MKSTKKWVSILLAGTMATLTACGSADNKESSSSPAAGSPQASNAPAEPAKVRLMISDHSQPVPTGNVMDNPTIKYMAQKANVNLDITFLPHGDYAAQKKIKYAAGDIPDVVQDWGVDADLMQNNQAIPLNDLIDKYGPNLKKSINKEAWDAVTFNGKIMGIPQTANGNAPSGRVIYVRKDWMDKVGIKDIPKTPDEFLTMLRAFRDKDPNGNGKKDEIPFTARENFSWSENLFGMFGANLHTYNLVNNELQPGYITPNFKKALGYVKTMVDEGLIDSEFMTNKRNVWEQKIQNDLAGSWNHVTELAWDWQDKLNKSIPGGKANVIAIPTPKDPGASAVGDVQNPIVKVFTISKKAKNPEAIVKMFDWLASQEGQEFVFLGVPGITQNKDGGKLTYDAKKDADDKTSLWRQTLFSIVSYNKDLLKVQLGNDAAVEKLDLSWNTARQEGIPNYLVGAPVFPSAKQFPDLTKEGNLWREAAAQIILGKKPLDSYDEFVKSWKAQGGNEMIKEATEYYNNKQKK